MKLSYLQSVWDKLWPESNLLRLFQTLFPAKTKQEINSVLSESKTSEMIESVMKQAESMNGFLSRWKLIFLRTLIRLAPPEKILETGVAHGSSSAVILEALDLNKRGMLYSIDLPIFEAEDGSLKPWLEGYQFKREDISTVKNKHQVGWLVPEGLRSRWELVLGDSLKELPKLLERLGQIDIFFHDSLHLYDHMMSEFELAWPSLKADGILLTDDIFIRNHAVLSDFAHKKDARFNNFLEIGVIPKAGRLS